jgi:hypothetical protein
MRTIQIAVTPKVLKFLQVKFGTCPKLSQKTNEGKFLFNLLKTCPSNHRYDKHLPEFSHSVLILASTDQIFGKGHRHVNSKVFYEFNKYMETAIREEFHALCDVVRSLGHSWTMNDCIDKFFQIYGFEETDYNYDALKRSYTRHTDERQQLQQAA